MLFDILGFLVCSGIIFFSGKKLSFYGDVIADKSGLGRVWIGLILMATVTSLPELVIGISSVTVVGAPDLAVGNVLGSCVFNLAILSLLDAIMPGQPILTRVTNSNVLAAALGSILLSLVGIGLFLPDEYVILDWIGITSLAFIVVYFFSIKLLHSYGRRKQPPITPSAVVMQEEKEDITLKQALLWYTLNALVVIAAALVLPYFSEEIAVKSGWGESFVATVFLAASSSLPEMAVAISAARLGAADLAVGNLFGSNIFNILLLSISDIFYVRGDLLKEASEKNIVTVFAVIVMNSIAIAALTIRPEKKGFRYMAWDTLLILLVYIASMIFLFFY